MIVSRADTALLVRSTSRRREHTRGLMHVLRPGSEEPLLEIGDRSLDSGIHRHRETSSSLSTRVQTSLLAGEIFSFHSPQRSHVLLPLVSHHRSSEKPCRRYRAAPGTCFAEEEDESGQGPWCEERVCIDTLWSSQVINCG